MVAEKGHMDRACTSRETMHGQSKRRVFQDGAIITINFGWEISRVSSIMCAV